MQAQNRAALAATSIALAVALCVSPAMAAGADYYLKLGGVEGESTDDKHKNQIEILSYSWGASQPATSGYGGGGGTGKVNVHDISMSPAATAGEAEITLKGAAHAERKRPGKVKYGDITMKRGTSAKESGEKGGTEDMNIGVGELQESTGGVSVAAGDVDGDGRAEKSTPKLAEAVATGARTGPPAGTGPGTLTLTVPAGMCKAGARYPTAELGSGSFVIKMADIMVSSCSPSSGGDRPMESMSLNYGKIL